MLTANKLKPSFKSKITMKYKFLFCSIIFLSFLSKLHALGTVTNLKQRSQTRMFIKVFGKTIYQEEPSSLAIQKMRTLSKDRKWAELIQYFAKENFDNWKNETLSTKTEAYLLRAKAYFFLKNGKECEIDCKSGLALSPANELLLLTFAENYAANLNDESQALANYRKIISITGRTNGWLPISCALAMAKILTDQVKINDALEVLDQFSDIKGMAPAWRIKILRAYGHAYAAQGKEKEALAKFQEALHLENQN